LVMNVRTFPAYTGQTYLVADELLAGGESNWISFVFWRIGQVYFRQAVGPGKLGLH